MSGGIPIRGLQDLLVYRELERQSPLSAVFQGIGLGIEEAREAQKQKRAEEENFSNTLKMVEQFNATSKEKIEGKMIPSIKDGKVSYEFKTATKADELKAKREERLTNQYALNNATKLRAEFINRPEVKDFVAVNTNVNAMDKLLQEALKTDDESNLVAVDQGLITMYNKLTDPQSVVRESEYARTPSNLPIVNAIYGAIAKVQQGGAGLTNKDRKALVQGAKIILQERAQPYNNALGEYNTLAEQYELDPSMITRGMKPFESTSSQVTEDGSSQIGRFKVRVKK